MRSWVTMGREWEMMARSWTLRTTTEFSMSSKQGVVEDESSKICIRFVGYIEGRFKSGHFTHSECVSHVECCSGLWTLLMYFERPFDWTLGFWPLLPLLPEIFPMCFKWNLFKLQRLLQHLFSSHERTSILWPSCYNCQWRLKRRRSRKRCQNLACGFKKHYSNVLLSV